MGGTLTAGRTKRIAVLEDDEPLRNSLVDLLATEGYDVVAYAQGRAALEALSTGAPPDLILLDMFMPDMNGWEFRSAQKKDPVLCNTPVVVLSGSDDAQVRAVDAELVLKKPFDSDALLASIEQLFAEIVTDRERRRRAA